MDCFEPLHPIHELDWDLIIMHPPCTAIANSGNRHYGIGSRGYKERLLSIHWTIDLWEAAKKRCARVALENPVGVLSNFLGKPQYIQPWQFGHGETKKTGLWLHGLPPLTPTNIVDGREPRIHKMPPSKDRGKLRSKTYPGIAKAMAEQWGGDKTIRYAGINCEEHRLYDWYEGVPG